MSTRDFEFDMCGDAYDDHAFVDDGTDSHLCGWPGTEGSGPVWPDLCGDAADSRNHRNDPNVITTPLAEIMAEARAARSEGPNVWVGCLACHNDGRLVGHWVDACEAAEVTPDEIHGSATSHDELWVFDHEGFHGVLSGECSPAEAARLAALLDGVDEPEAFGAWVANDPSVLDEDPAAIVEVFTDAYCGVFASERDYAEELAEEIGAVNADASWPNSCIDWDHAASELFCGDYWSADASDGRVFVFCSC